MSKDYPTEQWKPIQFDFEYANECRFEVSNFGRIRAFNKISKGAILKGSMINGYRIIRIRFFKARPAESQALLVKLRERIAAISKQVKAEEDPEQRVALETTLKKAKSKLAIATKSDEKDRLIYYQCLVHRLVATYFLNRPRPDMTVVAHLDYNKENNRSYNLKWMTPEENYAHQKLSPNQLADKNDPNSGKRQSPTTKLSVTKVMLLKKLLNQNKPVKQLAKQFRITGTQVIRIKKGENWGHIEAAKN